MVWLFLKSISSGSSEISYASSLPFVVCISVTSVARNMFVMHGIFKGEMCSVRFKVAVVGLVYKKVFISIKSSSEKPVNGFLNANIESSMPLISFAFGTLSYGL